MAGALDRATNSVFVRVIEIPTRRTMHNFVEENAVPDATIYTDEHPSYLGSRRNHHVVRHSAGQYVNDMASTNGLESHWALMKRGLNGTYHHVSVKHLRRYADEFAGRHNDRPLDTDDQMEHMAASLDGKRLRYQDLIVDLES